MAKKKKPTPHYYTPPNEPSTNSTGSKAISRATDKPQKLLSKTEYDNEMRKVAQELVDQGRMPSLEKVLDTFSKVLRRHPLKTKNNKQGNKPVNRKLNKTSNGKSEMGVPVLGLKQPVPVLILHDCVKAPNGNIFVAPDTRYSKVFASIDRGRNYHGSLREEFFVCRDNGYAPDWTVLWVTLNADQEEDSIQRIQPFCALASDWLPEDLENHVGSLADDIEPLELEAKEFVEHISELAPATIRCYADIVKAVVASAIDEHGEQLFPRTWNEEFIDAPLIKNQRQPSTDKEGLQAILSEAVGATRTLFALLSGCGPLRVGEALGLPIENVSKDARTLVINQKAKRGKIQTHLKTENGERQVDLCESLAALLREQIGGRRSGLVFCEEDGSQLMQRDILKYSLHPILKKLGLEQGGFNIFRRFRITQLETAECPKALQYFWSGHAQTHVSERYTKLLRQREYRLEWTEKVGMGFDLPERPVAHLAHLIMFRKTG